MTAVAGDVLRPVPAPARGAGSPLAQADGVEAMPALFMDALQLVAELVGVPLDGGEPPVEPARADGEREAAVPAFEADAAGLLVANAASLPAVFAPEAVTPHGAAGGAMPVRPQALRGVPAESAAAASGLVSGLAPRIAEPMVRHPGVKPQGEAFAPPASESGSTQRSLAQASAALGMPAGGEAPRVPETEAAPLRLPQGAPTAWRQPLMQALGDRLQLQLGAAGERAVIRLDPPMMGSVEIVVRHEAGALQVQLHASHPEVVRQLHAIGDALRQELAARQHGEVSVQIADGSRGEDGRQRPRQEEAAAGEPGHALAEAEAGHERMAFGLAPDRE